MIDAEMAWHVRFGAILNNTVTNSAVLNFSPISVIPQGSIFVKIGLGSYMDASGPGSTQNSFMSMGILEVLSGGVNRRLYFDNSGIDNVHALFQDRVQRVVVGGAARNALAAMVYTAQHWT